MGVFISNTPTNTGVHFWKKSKLFLMKKILFPLLTLAIIICGGLLWWNYAVGPVASEPKETTFLITKGSSAGKIAALLEEKGLVKSSLAFKFYIQLTGLSGKIQAGEYTLSPSDSLIKIVNILLSGPDEKWVTIPEGLRREEIAEKFADTLGKEDKREFVNEFLSLTKDKEGFLFPDTYIFAKEATAGAIVKKMLSTFDSKYSEDIERGLLSNNLTKEEGVVLASILERETLSEGEKPVVAGILLNRLNADWPLQADATVQYAIGSTKCSGKFECKWWEPVLKVDLETKSPFNTYKNTGLPPKPIANPGLTSIKAVANAQETEFWFYIHDTSGQIHYAKTIEEHGANVSRYLR